MKRITISNNYEDFRLDKALSLILESTSRNKIQEYIDSGFVHVNNKNEKASYKLRNGDEIIIDDFPTEKYDLEAENIALDIVYEDYDIVKIDEPYIPGFLAFREVKHLVKLIDNLKENCPQFLPQVILLDGNGIIHP